MVGCDPFRLDGLITFPFPRGSVTAKAFGFRYPKCATRLPPVDVTQSSNGATAEIGEGVAVGVGEAASVGWCADVAVTVTRTFVDAVCLLFCCGPPEETKSHLAVATTITRTRQARENSTTRPRVLGELRTGRLFASGWTCAAEVAPLALVLLQVAAVTGPSSRGNASSSSAAHTDLSRVPSKGGCASSSWMAKALSP
jgi:hypothetical protein